MSRSFTFVLLTLVFSHISAQQTAKPETTIEKFSYAIGYRMAKDLIRQNIQLVDPPSLSTGINDALTGQAFAIPAEDMQKVVDAYKQLVMQKSAAQSEQNIHAGTAFMQANKDKEGIQVFDNGIQYRIVNDAKGEKPKADDTVKVHYVGRLLDGQIFDSSRQRGQAAEFSLDAVIKGWTYTLQQMSVGSRWLVWIPPELAYGSRSPSGKIGPNQTLQFDIELLEVVKK